MIRWLTCESARELLEPFLDHELNTDDQVAVELHLRCCSTCAARVDDMALIGWSLRAGTPATRPSAEDARALALVQSDVLTRIRIEREQSFRARLLDWFADMRLFWPAVGATLSVLLCLWGAASVWQLARQTGPSSLVRMMETLAPGAEGNPLRIDSGMGLPRVIDDSFLTTRILPGEWQMALAAVVTRTGQVGDAEVLVPESLGPSHRQAVLDAVRHSRFRPAQSPDGRPVAARVVLLVVHTTISESALHDPIFKFPPPAWDRPAETAKTRPAPEPENPSRLRSSLPDPSTVA